MPLDYSKCHTIEEMDAETMRFKREILAQRKAHEEFWSACPEPWRSVGLRLAWNRDTLADIVAVKVQAPS